MLADILGRLLPRKKALAITAPAALLALTGALLLCGAAFFVYLQVCGWRLRARGGASQCQQWVTAQQRAVWAAGKACIAVDYVDVPVAMLLFVLVRSFTPPAVHKSGNQQRMQNARRHSTSRLRLVSGAAGGVVFYSIGNTPPIFLAARCSRSLFLQAPPRMQHDPFVMGLVLVLWLGGGYVK